ncbi:EVE domain-containing protein [Methanobacterium oryzae]|uniref:EVE domain-containing protein n=1 Tax=Methanobacterium oryzae TaxID=69540 RepID=UPI003D20FB55
MKERNYWLDLFTGTTWQEFLDAGGEISGFRKNRWTTVQKIKPGDYLLCYLTGVSRWIGILEVISEPFMDETPIWQFDTFPCRLKVKIVTQLEPETGIPVLDLRDKLTMFQNLKNPNRWGMLFRGSPKILPPEDGAEIVKAINYAEKNPDRKPVDHKKLARVPRGLKAPNIRTRVTIPEDDDSTAKPSAPTLHTEIQWLLLKLGNDMGLDVWAARNDRGKEFNGHYFADLPNIIDELPLQFDETTNKTIELIDVLWLKGNSITAAFEIESTTSIYSGLLRMSDLIAMQPNINIPLYLVAPDERRDKVIIEVNRPTFSHLETPLKEICRYIPFSELKKQINEAKSFLRHLKPEFLEDISESCELIVHE